MRNFFSIIFILSCFCIQAQYISSVTVPDSTKAIVNNLDEPRFKYANEIKAEDLYNHLSVLASDEFEGRETGEKGVEMASDYLVEYLKSQQFEGIGLEGSHKQQIGFTFSSWRETELYINDKRFKHLWDYLAFPNKNVNKKSVDANEVLFLGYGEANDYKSKEVKNQVILVYEGEGKTSLEERLILAKKNQVALVLIVKNDIKEFLYQNRKTLLGPTVELGINEESSITTANHIYISSTVAKEVIGTKSKKFSKIRKCLEKKGRLKKLSLPAKFQLSQKKKRKTLEGNNVMAYIEGTDKKDELVIVSAHYDHVGRKGDVIFNGADDNASGTSTILEIATAFKQAHNDGFAPSRSILFLWVTAEEKGLFGSEYYANNPLFSLSKTIANVNVDMVGRVDEKYKENPNYIYVIGSDRLSSDLHAINEQVNQDFTQLTLDYTYNDEKDPNRYYYRSDHYNFASRGIPAIFFFNGAHEDYHQPSDTIEKIEFDKMEKIGKHIYHLVWELANRGEAIKVDGE